MGLWNDDVGRSLVTLSLAVLTLISTGAIYAEAPIPSFTVRWRDSTSHCTQRNSTSQT